MMRSRTAAERCVSFYLLKAAPPAPFLSISSMKWGYTHAWYLLICSWYQVYTHAWSLLISSVHSVTITRYTSYGVRATLPLHMEYDTLLATLLDIKSPPFYLCPQPHLLRWGKGKINWSPEDSFGVLPDSFFCVATGPKHWSPTPTPPPPTYSPEEGCLQMDPFH